MLVIGGKKVLETVEELVDPKHTALLLIDLQNDYLLNRQYSHEMGWNDQDLHTIIPRIKQVLDSARDSGVMVVHVQMTFYPNCLIESPAILRMHLIRSGYSKEDAVDKIPIRCLDGTPGWQIIDDLTPLPTEMVIKKHRANAFVGTSLDLLLSSNEIKSIIFTGIVTHGCVMSTANDAPYFDYYPIILRDCVASYNMELHKAALVIMSEKMDVLESEELLKIWNPFATKTQRREERI